MVKEPPPQGHREGERLDDRAAAPRDGLGAIYPPMMYSVMALDALEGYARDHPLRADALRHFNNLMVDDDDRFFFQPCFSPSGTPASGSTRSARPIRSTPALRSCRLAAFEGSPPQGRLVGEASEYRAFRLGLRILQRTLSGHRRHRHGDARAWATCAPVPDSARQQAAATSARSTGCSRCNRAMADGRLSTLTTTGAS